MVDREFVRKAAKGMSPAALSDWFMDYYATQDLDHDGYLTLDELLKEPLVSFSCMDSNGDGRLSKTEIETGLTRCSSDNGDHSAPYQRDFG